MMRFNSKAAGKMMSSRSEMAVYYDELRSLEATEDCDSELSRLEQFEIDDDGEGNIDVYDENDSDNEDVAILGELVGARNLSLDQDQNLYNVMNNNNDNDPTARVYCVVKFGDRVIHRSKRARDAGGNPIWTISTRSLFLLRASPAQLSRSTLNISLYTKPDDSLPVPVRLLGAASREFLGQVNLDASEILDNCHDARFEVKIKDDIGEDGLNLGTLALRFRIATRSDENIMKTFCGGLSLSKTKSKKEFVDAVLDSPPSDEDKELFDKTSSAVNRPLAKLITETAETEIAASTVLDALSGIFTSRVVRDKHTGTNKFKVKPYPDPDRKRETQFMSKNEIQATTRQASTKWVEAGSGTLGKLYVEVLSCHDLPNVDVGEAVGNVTDSFVSLVYEDTCAMTEVIDDELSPHWLPWTQRAFCFGMMHPSSLLYIGVFDYDLGPGNHEALGRVAVNVANFQRNTVYTLKYNLYPSANVTDRTANGSITIRMRIECFDEKAALLAALQPRPQIHVNMKKEKSFKVIRYTCFGEHDGEEKFDLTVAKSYVNEIFEYKAALSYVAGDTVRSLMFWRGQVDFCTIMLPVHSFLFFCMSTDLVERPHKIVPYSFLGVAWAMIAMNTMIRQHPSPWNRPPSFWQYLNLLRSGKSSTPVEMIKEYEGNDAAVAYENAWHKRLEQDRLIAERRARLEEEINNIGDDNISTKVAMSAIPLELLGRLARYQGIIGRICAKFRFIKIIVTWEESIVSFWITAVFLGAGLISLILPWDFILLWTGRIFVWGCFGPHMKLVDMYLRSNTKNDAAIRELKENFDVQSKLARIRREEAVKQQDMKAIAFGQYSVRIPSFNIARHHDRPLPASCARICYKGPINKEKSGRRLSKASITNETPWIPGQQLFGTMIPRPEHEDKIFQAESMQSEQRLATLRDRVKSTSKGGILTKHRRDLLKRTDRHVSFGYQVVSQEYDAITKEDDEDPDLCTGTGIVSESYRSLQLLLTTDGDEEIAMSGSIEVVCGDGDLGDLIYDHDEQSVVSYLDEEGMEVVGLGRYSTIIGESSDDFHDEILIAESRDSIIHDGDDGKHHSRLSREYSSSRTSVAFYRPVDTHHAGHMKQD